jgi:hypothetical protein
MHLVLDHLAARYVHLEATPLAVDQEAAPLALQELFRVQQEPPHRPPVCLALQGVMHLALDHLVARYVHLVATPLALDQAAVRLVLREPPQVQQEPSPR